MSGKDERKGMVVLYDGKVSYVKGRIASSTKCEFPECNESDEFLVCKGARTRLSTLHTICCKEHLDWAIQCALTKPLGWQKTEKNSLLVGK